jgi:hypothetical protein
MLQPRRGVCRQISPEFSPLREAFFARPAPASSLLRTLLRQVSTRFKPEEIGAYSKGEKYDPASDFPPELRQIGSDFSSAGQPPHPRNQRLK